MTSLVTASKHPLSLVPGKALIKCLRISGLSAKTVIHILKKPIALAIFATARWSAALSGAVSISSLLSFAVAHASILCATRSNGTKQPFSSSGLLHAFCKPTKAKVALASGARPAVLHASDGTICPSGKYVNAKKVLSRSGKSSVLITTSLSFLVGLQLPRAYRLRQPCRKVGQLFRRCHAGFFQRRQIVPCHVFHFSVPQTHFRPADTLNTLCNFRYRQIV